MLRTLRNEGRGSDREMTVAADAKRGTGPRKVVEDERQIRDGRVIVSEGIGEVLLTAVVTVERRGSLHKLAEVVVEVDHHAGLVGGEELTDGEPELACGLVPSEHHVGDIFVDASMEDVEDGVVRGESASDFVL